MDPIQQLNNDLDAALEEVKTAVAAKNLEGAQTAKAKADGIKSLIEVTQSAAGIKTWQSTEAAPRDTTIATKAAVVGGAGAVQTGTVAGKTLIDLETGNVLEESGAGVLGTKSMTAIANPDYLKAYPNFLRSGGIENVKSVEARKFLSEGLDSDGGLLVPAEVLAGILKREPAMTRIVELTRTVTVGSDKATMLRSVYDADDLYSSAVRVYKTAEGAAATKANQPVFGTFNVDVHQFTAELSISRALLEDTNFDVMGYLAGEFRTAYRNFVADKILNGSGVGEHFGILTRAGSANGPAIVKTGVAGGVTFDSLQAIKFAVPEQYDQNCRFVFNKRSMGLKIASLKDADGRPLWPVAQQAGMVNGEPANLLGYNYAYESFMPDAANNALAGIFGDLTGYVRALRLGMSLEPLREIEARRGQVVFLARFREGGDVAEPYRLKVLQTAV